MKECDFCEEVASFGSLCATCAAKELGAIAQGYERRRVGDQARLAAMMHYAQSVECRGAQLLRYFGERGARCGVCDVCGGAS